MMSENIQKYLVSGNNLLSAQYFNFEIGSRVEEFILSYSS